MKRFSRTFASLVFVGLASVATIGACGGSQDAPATPLSTRFQDTYIAQIAPDKQAGVLEAQTAWNAAKMEQAKAEADLRETNLAADLAANEAKQAVTALDSAKKAKAVAVKSADQDRIKQADSDFAAADATTKSATARREYLSAYTAWLKKLYLYTTHNTAWKESQYELAKAKVAQGNNIAPPGFAAPKFEQQEVARAKAAGVAKDKSAAQKEKAAAARANWLKLQAETDKLTGKPSTYSDPMGKIEAGKDITIPGDTTKSDTMAPNAVDPTAKPAGAGSGSDAGAGSGSAAGSAAPK